MKGPLKSAAAALPASSAEPGAPLELPVDPGFIPLHFRTDPELAIGMPAAYLPRLLARPEFWAERAEQRCLVEFDLDHPERHPATYPAAAINELFQQGAPPQGPGRGKNTAPTRTGSHP